MAEVEGLEAFDALLGGLDKLTAQYASDLVDRVKSYTPVDTGNLRDHWHIESLDSTTISIVNDAVDKHGVFYGPFVEYGTVHMRGFFMMTRTIAEATQIFESAKRKVGL